MDGQEVLKPYLAVNLPPPGIVPVILLDVYQCHDGIGNRRHC